MENRKKIAGILVMVILGVSLVAINASAQDANSLEGVWVHLNPESGNARIVISGDSFVYTWAGGEKKGTFTVNRNNITFNADDRSSWRTTFEFRENGDLWFNQGRGLFHWYGLFGKIDPELRAYRAITANTRATPLEGSWIALNQNAGNAKFVFSGNSFTLSLDQGERKGRFTLDGNNISLHTDEGLSWITAYSFTTLNTSDWNWVATDSPEYNSFIHFDSGMGNVYWGGSGYPFGRIPPNASIEGTWKHRFPQALREVTFTFSGDTFTYTTGRGTRTGTFERTDNRIILTVNRRVVREYFYHFYDEGSLLYLIDVSGDSNTYIQGPLDKQ